jgi:actin-related protein
LKNQKMEEDAEIIIMDIGSGAIKAGFARNDQPKCYIPMIVGKPIDDVQMVGMDQKDFYFGDEAITKKSMLDITYPVKQGIVPDDHSFEMLEKILEHQIFNQELRVSPEDHKCMLTEPPGNPKENREKMVDLMFNTFKVPKLYLGNQAVLSLFATGRTTGTVIDSGEGITHAVPIYEGYAIPHAI